jgi:hypothetical protein
MSFELRVELYRQLASKTTRYGSNVRVIIPAGDLSNEMRQLSVALINARALRNGSPHTGALPQPNRDLPVILHHKMVAALLKQDDASRFIQTESRVRFCRVRPALHLLLSKSFSGCGPKAVFDIHFEDAVSVTEVGVSASRLFGNYPYPLTDFEMDREVLRIVRYVIAPYNTEHADVHVIFHPDNLTGMMMDLNGAPIGR